MANNDDKPIGMASMGFIRVTSIAFCVTSPQRCCCWQRWGCKCAVSTYSSTAHCPWVHVGSTQPSSLYRTCCKPTHSCVGCRSSTLIWYNGVPGWSLIPRPDRCSSGAQSDFEELNDAVLCSNTANTVKLVKTLHDDSHSTAICSAMVDHCHPSLASRVPFCCCAHALPQAGDAESAWLHKQCCCISSTWCQVDNARLAHL